MVQRWLAEAEGFNRSAARLLAIAQLPRVGAPATTAHLNEIEQVGLQLAEASRTLERTCRELAPEEAESRQFDDVRSSFALSRAILEQARMLLEARSRLG